MKENRRQFARITVDIPAALSYIQVDSYHKGALANLSMGGCFFPMESNLPLGAECDISITLGEGVQEESYLLQGRVVRSDGMGVGIKFFNCAEQVAILFKKIQFNTSERQTE